MVAWLHGWLHAHPFGFGWWCLTSPHAGGAPIHTLDYYVVEQMRVVDESSSSSSSSSSSRVAVVQVVEE